MVARKKNFLRHDKFMEMITSSKSSLNPQKLPPTERVAYFHLQVILWKDLANDNLDPEQWGWKLDGTVLVPVMTDQAPAPEKSPKVCTV